MNYLCIDYGQRHLGLAFANSPIAQPLTEIDTKNAAQEIPRLIKSHNIGKIIIGLPDEQLLTTINNFVSTINFDGCEIDFVDETLSSHDARNALAHTTQTNRRQKEHSVAAAIILQTFLDNNRVDF